MFSIFPPHNEPIIYFLEASRKSVKLIQLMISSREGSNVGNTVEPGFTDTRLIRTPGYFEQFRLSRRGKAHTFSLKLTRLIRTSVNTDTLGSVLTGFHCIVVKLVFIPLLSFLLRMTYQRLIFRRRASWNGRWCYPG